jgi:hypothetical protein
MKSELTNKDVMIWLKAKWSELYVEVRKEKISNQEYAVRRRIYERMIWELGNPNDLLPIIKK